MDNQSPPLSDQLEVGCSRCRYLCLAHHPPRCQEDNIARRNRAILNPWFNAPWQLTETEKRERHGLHWPPQPTLAAPRDVRPQPKQLRPKLKACPLCRHFVGR